MSSIPDFSGLSLPPRAAADVGSRERWEQAVADATGLSVDKLGYATPEGIDVAPLYTAADLDGLDHLATYPGIAPYLRWVARSNATDRPFCPCARLRR